jgi:hypothetical protein
MMMWQPSHSSSMSGSATSAASPKGRLSKVFSKKRPSMSGSLSREDNGSSDKIYEVGLSLKLENGMLIMISSHSIPIRSQALHFICQTSSWPNRTMAFLPRTALLRLTIPSSCISARTFGASVKLPLDQIPRKWMRYGRSTRN